MYYSGLAGVVVVVVIVAVIFVIVIIVITIVVVTVVVVVDIDSVYILCCATYGSGLALGSESGHGIGPSFSQEKASLRHLIFVVAERPFRLLRIGLQYTIASIPTVP